MCSSARRGAACGPRRSWLRPYYSELASRHRQVRRRVEARGEDLGEKRARSVPDAERVALGGWDIERRARVDAPHLRALLALVINGDERERAAIRALVPNVQRRRAPTAALEWDDAGALIRADEKKIDFLGLGVRRGFSCETRARGPARMHA